MPRILETPELSAGQAYYAIERLISEGRVAPAEVARYVADIPGEIAQLEARLQQLRDARGPGAASQQIDSPKRGGSNGRGRRRATKRRGNPLAGCYMGYMRQVPAARQEKYRRLKQEQGYQAAIAQLKSDLSK